METSLRGEIQVMQPDAFRDRFGAEPPTTERGARLAALRFAVRDLDAVAELLRAESIAGSSRMGRIIWEVIVLAATWRLRWRGYWLARERKWPCWRS